MANAFVYSTGNKVLRRVNPSGPLLSATGEAVATGVIYVSTAAWLAALSTKTGLTIIDGRCALIDTLGNVVAVIYADPALDSVSAGLTMVLSAVANVGWTWTSVGGFVAPPHGVAVHTRP